MSKNKLHHLKFVPASQLFAGVTSVGSVFGTQLAELGASLTPRVALERHWISDRNYSATIAVVETKVRAPATEAQVANLRNWLAARRLISAVLAGSVPTEAGFPRYEAARMLLRAGLIETPERATERNSPDGEHSHRIPKGEIKEALEWFSHPSRVENVGLQFARKPWDIPWDRVQPAKIRQGDEMVPNPEAGQPWPVSRDYLTLLINSVKELESFTVEGGRPSGPLIFDLVPGPLLPLASCTPTPDGMELRKGQTVSMRNRQFVSLTNYTSGVVYVLKLTVLENRATVLVAVPDVYRGAGKKGPDGKVDWSKQERLQKGVGRKEGGRWALTWQSLPPSRRIVRADGEELLCWQPFAQYESGSGVDRLSGHLTAFLKRVQLDALGVIGLSWLQNQGGAEVVLSYIQRHDIGAEMMGNLHEDLMTENQIQVDSRKSANAIVAITSPVTAPERVEQTEATLKAAAEQTTPETATPEQAEALMSAIAAAAPREQEQEPEMSAGSLVPEMLPEMPAAVAPEDEDENVPAEDAHAEAGETLVPVGM